MASQKELIQLWSEKGKDYKAIVDHYFKTAPNSYSKNSYELSKETGLQPAEWKEFLQDKQVQQFVSSEIDEINQTQLRGAMLNLGKAETSVEVAKVKAYKELARKDKVEGFKEFNMFFFPKDVKRLKSALRNIQRIVNHRGYDNVADKFADITNEIHKAAPDLKDN